MKAGSIILSTISAGVGRNLGMGHRPRIAIVGDWDWPIYEEAFASGLRALGVEVMPIQVGKFYGGRLTRYCKLTPVPTPTLIAVNIYVRKQVRDVAPDIVLLWRSVHLLPSTIRAIQKQNVIIVTYNNDDPFGPKQGVRCPWYHRWMWHWYLRSLLVADLNFFYRQCNIVEARGWGVKHADLMLPYYIPEKDAYVDLSPEEQSMFCTDVVFVGHYESDHREECLLHLKDAGLSVKVFGDSRWNSRTSLRFRHAFGNIIPAQAKEYSKALSGAKVAITFLSKLNRDEYTRRSFEIPAHGVAMVSERSKALAHFFKEDEEIVFFSNAHDLVQKVRTLVLDEHKRISLAEAARRRLLLDGHDVNTRAKAWLQSVESKISEIKRTTF